MPYVCQSSGGRNTEFLFPCVALLPERSVRHGGIKLQLSWFNTAVQVGPIGFCYFYFSSSGGY